MYKNAMNKSINWQQVYSAKNQSAPFDTFLWKTYVDIYVATFT